MVVSEEEVRILGAEELHSPHSPQPFPITIQNLKYTRYCLSKTNSNSLTCDLRGTCQTSFSKDLLSEDEDSMKRSASSRATAPGSISTQQPTSCQFCRARKLKCDRRHSCFNFSSRDHRCVSDSGKQFSLDYLPEADCSGSSRDASIRMPAAEPNGHHTGAE